MEGGNEHCHHPKLSRAACLTQLMQTPPALHTPEANYAFGLDELRIAVATLHLQFWAASCGDFRNLHLSRLKALLQRRHKHVSHIARGVKLPFAGTSCCQQTSIIFNSYSCTTRCSAHPLNALAAVLARTFQRLPRLWTSNKLKIKKKSEKHQQTNLWCPQGLRNACYASDFVQCSFCLFPSRLQTKVQHTPAP